MSIEFPGPSWRAPLDRRAAALFFWDIEDALRNYRLTARTGQLATLVRAAAGNYVDGHGVTRSAVHSQPRFTSISYGGRYESALSLGQANGGSTEDGLSFVIGFRPQALTVYVRGFQSMAGYGDGTPNWPLMAIGSTLYDDAGPGVSIGDHGDASGRLYGRHKTGAGTRDASANLGASAGALVEHRLVLAADGSVIHGASVNEGAETTASNASTLTLAATFGAAVLWVGNIDLQRLVVLGGVRSLAQMRAN